MNRMSIKGQYIFDTQFLYQELKGWSVTIFPDSQFVYADNFACYVHTLYPLFLVRAQ